MGRRRGLAAALVALALPGGAGARLAYYSDYFSFVGQDAAGRVAFALDTNRGQDADAFQAEHFAALHAEAAGWIGLQGSGPFPNRRHVLEGLPDSEHFRFSGAPASGIEIASPANALSLRVGPVPVRLDRVRDRDRYWMGSAPAVLEWAGRTVPGRVIYEHLHLEGWNRLTRTYPGFWRDYHGLYLRLEDPAGAAGDFYLHRHRSEKLAGLTGRVDGFAVLAGEDLRLAGAAVEVTARRLALGFFRWPAAWSGRWAGDGREVTFSLRLEDRRTFANWVLGGFALGVVRGTVAAGGRTWDAYGLGELIE